MDAYRWECPVCQCCGSVEAKPDTSADEIVVLCDLQHANISPRCPRRGTAPPLPTSQPCVCSPAGHRVTCVELDPVRANARFN